jgi:hypothetical protein
MAAFRRSDVAADGLPVSACLCACSLVCACRRTGRMGGLLAHALGKLCHDGVGGGWSQFMVLAMAYASCAVIRRRGNPQKSAEFDRHLADLWRRGSELRERLNPKPLKQRQHQHQSQQIALAPSTNNSAPLSSRTRFHWPAGPRRLFTLSPTPRGHTFARTGQSGEGRNRPDVRRLHASSTP